MELHKSTVLQLISSLFPWGTENTSNIAVHVYGTEQLNKCMDDDGSPVSQFEWEHINTQGEETRMIQVVMDQSWKHQ